MYCYLSFFFHRYDSGIFVLRFMQTYDGNAVQNISNVPFFSSSHCPIPNNLLFCSFLNFFMLYDRLTCYHCATSCCFNYFLTSTTRSLQNFQKCYCNLRRLPFASQNLVCSTIQLSIFNNFIYIFQHFCISHSTFSVPNYFCIVNPFQSYHSISFTGQQVSVVKQLLQSLIFIQKFLIGQGRAINLQQQASLVPDEVFIFKFNFVVSVVSYTLQYLLNVFASHQTL